MCVKSNSFQRSALFGSCEWRIMGFLFKRFGAQHSFQAFFFFSHIFFHLITFPAARMHDARKMCNRSHDFWLISRNSNGWGLQTGNSAAKYAANDKVWVPIRVQYMRTAAANGLKQMQRSHFRCEQKENRGRANSWWGLQTVWWDTTLAITVSMKSGVPYNLPQH